MTKIISLLFLLSVVSGCQSTSKVASDKTDEPLIMDSQIAGDYTSIFDDDTDEKKDDKFQAYFYDSRGQRFLTNKSSASRLDTTTSQLIEQTLQQAFSKLPYIPESMNISLEVNAPYVYKDEVLYAAQAYIVDAPNLTIQAQAEETQAVIGKILKRELDPFYDDNSGQFDDVARASDLILYLLVSEKDKQVVLKSSVLSKSGQILGIKSATMDSGDSNFSQSGFVLVSVPYATTNGSRTFELMKSAVSQEQLYGVGSGSIAASNMSLDQANAYCTQHNMLLTSPYVFEFARRKGEFDRPKGIANLELIAALDSEDADYDFYRERDYLELEDDLQSNHFLVFDWNSETYSIVSNSFTSEKMAFRCYKP